MPIVLPELALEAMSWLGLLHLAALVFVLVLMVVLEEGRSRP